MADHTHVVLNADPSSEMPVSFGMPHCKDCRWWARQHDALGKMPGGLRSAPMIGGEAGVCLLTETKSLDAEHPTSKAVVWEGDGYTGVLVTREDFGCVQFEVKTDG